MKYSDLPILSIVGPTASGKSDLAIAVAFSLGGEVVSADSMQIYRGMDIGTAKVPQVERRVPHHLIDIIEPGQAYSAQLFQRDARIVFDDLYAQGKLSVLCGGTGFYVQAALDHMDFPKGEQLGNPIRDKWQAYADEHGATALWERLDALDARSAAAVHPNNVRRVIRALEMHEQGVSYADQVDKLKQVEPEFASVRFGLSVDRDRLVERINRRVDLMFERGLVDEVSILLEQGFEGALTAPQAIGYKEVVSALKGQCSFDQAREDIKLATRRYAKRQRSWFRRDKRLIWLDANERSTESLADEVLTIYEDRRKPSHAISAQTLNS